MPCAAAVTQTPITRMSRRRLREKLAAFLEERNFAAVVDLASQEQAVADVLLQFLYDPHDILQWRALEGLGRVAEAHPDQVRKVITRLLWLLNEDSGSFGWGAAAALGEIGRQQLSLVRDVIPMFCGFLREDFSREPMLWGIGRLAETHPEVLAEVVPDIMACLTDANPQVKALSAWSLGRIGAREAREELQGLAADNEAVLLYDQGDWRRTTVGELAREALARLD
ncbi:MAG: HEAT repeat domain-containing protein [Deltaproteobacteria bacterium]|nr:HEAT repeat domain-containing protein [Deltaproteobacteria bacterium]